MASARNNKIQDRRAALREQQKLERLAADEVFKLLTAEEEAREATAAGVADLVDKVGAARAGALAGLDARDIAAYLKLHDEVSTDDDAADDGEPSSATQSEQLSDAELAGQSGTVPVQVGPVSAASVAAE
ncbi:hypothetical protein ACIOJE_34990 [Kitasatospora sp. NPDC087861]|uniref:hypothetical protein n=1 Tax=Kitasatospora sp. NPDC087861 TaxID=3364070 RepID=UPI0038235272